MTDTPAGPVSTTRLLLVDDDDFVRGALARALDHTGAFTVIPAMNGEHALELLESEQVDAMLTDLQMPMMDGLTLIGCLFERGIHLPVAVMTGQSIAPELSRRLHDFGIAATFTKPIDVGTLADELQRALSPQMVGRIQGITLFGLLQLLEVERKTALIVVRALRDEGRLFFEDGELADANVRRKTGLEAVYEILGWTDPSVEIFYRRRSRQRTVTEPLQHVLMEAARLHDERGNAGGERVQESLRTQAPPADSPVKASSDARSAATPRVSSRAKPLPENRNVGAALAEALEIPGAIGAALVHASSGMALGEAGGSAGFSMSLAAAVTTDLVRAQAKGMNAMRLDDTVEDIVVTLGTQYHVIVFAGLARNVFLYLVLARDNADVVAARTRLRTILNDRFPGQGE
jgi:CheY-like chemotaxis protein